MNNPQSTPEALPRLAEFRQQIDALDDKIIALLKERIGIVSQVGAMKRQAHPGQCPIRAGREAEMVRRIIGAFEGGVFPPAAAAAMWRILIGASTSIENQLKLSVYAPDKEETLFWLAREYFGPSVPAARQSQAKRVIGDVLDGKASVGIVPRPRGGDTGQWWTSLIQQGDAPKVFAHVPFVHSGAPSHDTPAGLAIARIAPEATGDDVSLLVLEAGPNVSQNRLQTAFASATLEAAWIDIATITPQSRHHLLEIRGFVTPEDEAMKTLRASLADSIVNISFLGAYAAPVVLKTES